MKYILDQRRLARARYARDAHQALKRYAHIDALEIMGARAAQLEPPVGAPFGDGLRGSRALGARCHDELAAAQILAR